MLFIRGCVQLTRLFSYSSDHTVAGGGAPGNCDFSVAGEECPKTCSDTKPNIDPTDDPEYRDFKDLYSCIEDKCVVQLGACERNPDCDRCCK
jgi:hypothetical protein